MSKNSIFLSYAKEDDEQFVMRLYKDLSIRGFEVWLDREKMPTRGLPFSIEIREAIDSCERFVLVVGPSVATSKWCRAEWQHADVFGRPITPVVRMDGTQPDGEKTDGFNLIPTALKLQELHAYDFRNDDCYAENFERLVAQLSKPVVSPGRLHGVPALPFHLVERYDRVQLLRDALLTDFKHPVSITGVQGMGGIGKSVLAGLLVRDPKIRRAFPDGIFWIPLGIQPNILQCQIRLATCLGYSGPRFEDVEEGRLRLSQLLVSRNALFILDDVWTREAVEAFNVMGSKCRAVLTTRDSGLVTSIGGTHYQLALLTDTEALKVLAQAAGVDAVELPDEAIKIADFCKNLPLALALSGGLVRRGVTWREVLRRFEQTMLKRIRDRHPDPANPQHGSMSAAIMISIDSLSREDRARLIELSVFPIDCEVPQAAAQTLWKYTGDMDDSSCNDLIVSLRERSLLLPDKSGEIAIHDLIHSFLSSLAGASSHLQEQLLYAYSVKCSGEKESAWATGPKDGYFFERLAWHLYTAGRHEELASLLVNYRWLQSKLEATDVTSLCSDFDYLDPSTHDDVITSVQQVLRLSYLILSEFPHELPAQLIGRFPRTDDAKAQTLLCSARQLCARPAILPLTPTLYGPGGSLLCTYSVSGFGFRRIDVTLDGNRVLSLSGKWGNNLSVRDLRSGVLQYEIKHKRGVPLSYATTSNSEYLVTAGSGTVNVWNTERGNLIQSFNIDPESITSLAAYDKSRIVAGSDKGVLRLWDINSQILLCSLKGKPNRISSVCLLGGRTQALSASGCTVSLWDLDQGNLLQQFEGHESDVESIAVAPDGHWAISYSFNYYPWHANSTYVGSTSFRTWSLKSKAPMYEFTCKGRVVGVAFTPDSQHVVIVFFGGTIEYRKIGTGQVVDRLNLDSGTNGVGAMTLSPDGRFIILGIEEAVRVVELDPLRVKGTIGIHMGFFANVQAVAAAPDSTTIISGAWDGSLRAWTIKGLSHNGRQSSSGKPTDVMLTERFVVSVTTNGSIEIRNSADNSFVRLIHGLSDRMIRLIPCHGGQYVASTGWNSEGISVWNVMNGKHIGMFLEPPETVLAMRLTSHYVYFATIASTGKSFLWQAEIQGLQETRTGNSNTPMMVSEIDLQNNSEFFRSNSLFSFYHAASNCQSYSSLMALASNCSMLINGDESTKNYELRVWDILKHELRCVLRGHHRGILCIAAMHDKMRAVSGDKGGNMIVWDLETGEPMISWSAHHIHVNALEISECGRFIFSASDDSTIKVWDFDTGNIVSSFHCDSAVMRIRVKRDRIAAVEKSGAVHLLEYRM